MSTIHIFIGPKKTGTSWLHHVVGNFDDPKEIRYPEKIGRNYVFKKYVSGKRLLIWPYLVHEPKSLNALLADLEKRGIDATLYFSHRNHSELLISMIKFKEKYGLRHDAANADAIKELDEIDETIKLLEAKNSLVHVQIINPEAKDLSILSQACDISIDKLNAQRNTRIYETTEVSRFRSRALVRMFFIIKPFLPANLQSATQLASLRRFFLKNKSN